ncbi:MAG: hypothetical protein WA741_15555 [Candidatus Sulfotelmatobacter sp.]
MLGAIYALKGGILGKFSDNGDSGLIEVRIRVGKVLGVRVARLDDAHPPNGRGERAGWQLMPDDIARLH